MDADVSVTVASIPFSTDVTLRCCREQGCHPGLLCQDMLPGRGLPTAHDVGPTHDMFCVSGIRRDSWRRARISRPSCRRWRRSGRRHWGSPWPPSTSAPSPASSTSWYTSTPSASPSATPSSSGTARCSSPSLSILPLLPSSPLLRTTLPSSFVHTPPWKHSAVTHTHTVQPPRKSRTIRSLDTLWNCPPRYYLVNSAARMST